MKQIRRLQPGGPLYSEDYNAIAAEVVRLMKLNVSGPDGTELASLSGGPSLILPDVPQRIRARIDPTNTISDIGACSVAYSWWEQRPLQGGCWEDIPEAEGGRRGDAATEPAYEANGQIVESPCNVWLYPGHVQNLSTSVKRNWYFDVPAVATDCCCDPPIDPCDLEAIGSVCLTIGNVFVNGVEVIGDEPFSVTLAWSGNPNLGLVGSLGFNTTNAGFVNFTASMSCIEGQIVVGFYFFTPGSTPAHFDMNVDSTSPFTGSSTASPGCYNVITGPWVVNVCTPLTFVGPGACPS